jgi:hypothetical protein
LSERLRIALLDHTGAAAAADALAAAGDPTVVSSSGFSLIAKLLALRKIGDRPDRVPATWRALASGAFDVAHAFTPQDAAVAALWSRRSGRPSVFTVTEPVGRERLADRRLRLAQWRLALDGVSAVVAPDAQVAESLARWMAVEARVIALADAKEHLSLYASLRSRSGAP